MQEYSIRPMKEGEKPEILALMKASFEPSLESIFYIHPESTLVAEYEKTLVAGINLDIYTVNRKTKIGYIGWLYTDKDHRKKGLAGRLVEQAVTFLADQGCTDLCACVEGDNPSSFKQLSKRGFSILSLRNQLHLFGFGILKVYSHASRFFDMGYFLWHYPLAPENRKPLRENVMPPFAVTLFINTILWTACLKGWNVLHLLGLGIGTKMESIPLKMLFFPAFFLGIRTLAMGLSAKAQKIETEYKGWDTAWITALLTTFLFGFPFPVPGNLYVKGTTWSLRPMQKKLTLMARASNLALAVACLVLAQSVALWYGLSLLTLDTLFFFYPFCGFNAHRLFKGGLATKATSLALLLVVFLFVLV
jgi:GNAT superfamily N-acetyltransferase